MEHEGPILETLLRRLAECPAEFLAQPRIGSAGTVDTAAVVSDLLHDLGGPPLSEVEAALFRTDERAQRNRLRAVLVACWLLHDPWFCAEGRFAAGARQFLAKEVGELAKLVQAPQLISDPDRREELARLCLRTLGLRPAGETAAQAEDRLTTLNSLERQRVIREAQAAEERARQVREAMAQAAQAASAAQSIPE
jgi:hypothetical protein